MDEKKFQKRGWICAALAPIACALFLLGRLAGLWDRTGDQNAAILACQILGTSLPEYREKIVELKRQMAEA